MSSIAKMISSGCILFYPTILSCLWCTINIVIPLSSDVYVFPLFTSLNYYVINLGKVQGAKGAHSRCAPVRKASLLQRSNLENPGAA